MSFRIANTFIILAGVIDMAVSNTGQTFGPTEYCHLEHFNATCTSGGVIIILKARLGRMEIGRCATRDLGFLGCQRDVTTILASRCSGRQHCDVAVQESFIYDENPCVQDTTAYLEVTHKCLKVVSAPANSCHKPITVSAKDKDNEIGFISTVVSEQLAIGTSRCPWQITANPGQRLNLTLVAFVSHSSGTTNSQQSRIKEDACYEVANVREHGSNRRNILACIPETQAVQFRSQSHTVQISLPHQNALHKYGAFLIKYEAVGCPHITNTGDSVVKMGTETATIQCPHTGKVWHLTCSGTSWIGHPGNCTHSPPSEESAGSVGEIFQHNTFPYALLVAVAIGVALGVFLGGLLLTVVAMHNKRKRHMHPPVDSDSVYYDSKTHAHYCELNSLHAHHNIHCHTHTRTPDVTSTRSADVSETSESRDYFLKPDPDLFCTIDRTYDRNAKHDKTKYGVQQER